jgi:hypothetical protein
MVPFLAFGQSQSGGLPALRSDLDKIPQLFFKNNRAGCNTPPPGPPECHIPPYIHAPWVPFWPNLNPYTKLVELTLPDGDYLVTAKLSAYAVEGAAWFLFECALYDERFYDPNNPNDPAFSLNPGVDQATFDGTYHQGLFFQTPVSFQTGSGGTMIVGCKSTGYKDYWGGNQHVDMFVWNVNVAAIRVGTVVKE